MLKVAVLGANGFIGGRIVEMFHLGGLAEVRPVVRSMASAARLSRFRIDFKIADAFDKQALTTAFAGCDVIVHAVGGDRNTILGTLAPTYEAAQAAGARRLVYLSTATVHGQAPEPGTTESSPLSDRQPIEYNNSKVIAERTLLQLRAQGKVELVMLRPGIVFGPRAFWVTNFADSLLKGEAYLVDGGRGICNSMYVDNLVHAIHLAMTVPSVDREVFLLGDREKVTWADLYRPIAEVLGFDLAQVPDASVPSLKPSWRGRLKNARESKPVRRVSSMVPGRLRRAVWAAISSPEAPTSWPSPWGLPTVQAPRATLEMALLYRCQYKVPFAKASKVLGYEAPVSFEVACRRTVSWLEFAGYPVVREATHNVEHPDKMKAKVMR